jgi:hypothetical protein
MDPLGFSVAVMQFMGSLPSEWLSMKQLISHDPRSAAPGAEKAYVAFITAATSLIYRFGLLADLGVPPRLQGGLWTFPAVMRSHRVLVDQNEALLVAFGQIAALGSTDALEAAGALAGAIAEVGKNWPSQRWPNRHQPLMDALHAAGERLGDFTRAVRKELASPTPSTSRH